MTAPSAHGRWSGRWRTTSAAPGRQAAQQGHPATWRSGVGELFAEPGQHDVVDPQAELRARAAEHDVLGASFTAEGHLAYDVDARPFFTYRFLSGPETDEDVARAVARAEAAARAAFEHQELGYQLRSTQVQDLSKAPLSTRQRRT